MDTAKNALKAATSSDSQFAPGEYPPYPRHRGTRSLKIEINTMFLQATKSPSLTKTKSQACNTKCWAKGPLVTNTQPPRAATRPAKPSSMQERSRQSLGNH